MTRRITVRDVHERHDCAGRKFIQITSMEEDEIVPTYYSLPSFGVSVSQKLFLSTVEPHDEVEVEEHPSSIDPMMLGSFLSIATSNIMRPAVCRCGAEIQCDGFDLFCPNLSCWLTLKAKLQRLSGTQFFDVGYDKISHPEIQAFLFDEVLQYTQPFLPVIEPRLWGDNSRNIDQVLSRYSSTYHVSLATFMVEDLFRDFIDYARPNIHNESVVFRNIAHFYGAMEELTNRRNYQSISQHKLITEFLWSLGIESLDMDMITKLVNYEHALDFDGQVLTPYAFLLGRPQELVNELGTHPLEAQTIANEFRSRALEFYDIFMAYTDGVDIQDIFKPYFRGPFRAKNFKTVISR